MKKSILIASIALMVTTPAFADLKIGLAGPMTGGAAAVGAQTSAGAREAIEDVNARGGVLGQKLSLQVEDDAADPKQAVSVANHLISDGIQFVVGDMHSGAAIASSQVYQDAGVLQITPSATNPKFTEQGLWNVFRTCGRDDQQGSVAGKYVLDTYAGKKVFIVHDKTPYGLGLAEEVRRTLNRGGLTEISFEGLTVGEKDFSALVSKIKASGADVVYFGGLYSEGGLLLRQMRDQSLKIPMVGGDGLYSSEFTAIAGPGADGTMITFGPDATKNPSAREVVARLKKKDISPDGFTLYSYAAVQVIAQAISKAGTADPEQVAKIMHSGIEFQTVVGPISYNEMGDIKQVNFILYKIDDGKFVEAVSQ